MAIIVPFYLQAVLFVVKGAPRNTANGHKALHASRCFTLIYGYLAWAVHRMRTEFEISFESITAFFSTYNTLIGVEVECLLGMHRLIIHRKWKCL